MAGLDLRKYPTISSDSTASAREAAATQAPEKPSGEPKSLLDRELSFSRPRLSDKQKEALYLELGTMISAGVDIKAALDLAEEEQTQAKHATIIRDIKTQIINGASFSEALQQSGYFTPYEYYSIQIGEEIGQLSPVLHELASYFTQKGKQRRQFISALSYPLLVLVTSLGAVGFMLYFIVPMFSDVFKRFGGELPYITQLIIDLSQGLSTHIGTILLAMGGLMATLIFISKKAWFERLSAQLLVKVPVFGKVYTGIHLARFCSSMTLLIGAQVPLLRAVQLVRQMVRFYPIRTALAQVEQDIMAGQSLHQSLAQFGIFDARLVALVKVGEEVNQLSTFFGKLATHYSEEVEHKTSLLSTFMEPLMIIFLGGVVGFILIAMYLPMFQLSTSIGG